MNKKNMMLSGWIIPAAVLLMVAPALAAERRVDIESKYSQAETVSKIEEALGKSQMMILAKPDLQGMVSQFGANIDGAQLVLFANPKMGGMLMKMDPSVGLEMPMKFFVFEKGGKVWVSYNPHQPRFADYKNDKLSQQSKKMDMMMKSIAEYAAQGKEMKMMPMGQKK